MTDAEITLSKTVNYYGDECVLVAHVTRGRGRFNVTADLYGSKRAYELRSEHGIIACGQLVEEVRKHFPELRPIQNLHLSDVETGEPMHAMANARYHVQNGNPEHAASLLRVDVANLPGIDAGDEIWQDFIDDQRWRWQREAAKANEWIDAHLSPDELPKTDVAEYTLNLTENVSMAGELDGAGVMTRDERGDTRYIYSVSITDGENTYTSKFGGSVADFVDGKVDARAAVLGTLHDLCDLANYATAEDYAAEMGMDTDEVTDQWREAHAAAMYFEDALRESGEIVGVSVF